MKRSRPSRTLTTFTVGFLLLDAVLLGIAWFELRRPGLAIGALACAAAAGAVVIAWLIYRRRYEASMAEIGRDMRQDVEQIRELLYKGNLHN